MKRFVYAMSKSRRDVGGDIEQGTRQLILHLIKLWFFPNSPDKSKWRKEVADKLNFVDSFKGSHKYPSKDFILDNSWNVHKPRFTKYIEYIILDYGSPENGYSYGALFCSVTEYFDWLAEVLSQDGQVPYTAVYNELEALGF